METVKKRHRVFPMLCSMLVLMACCFRTAAVLREEQPLPMATESRQEETYLYIPREDPAEPRETSSPDRIPSDIALVEIDNRCGAEFSIEELFCREISLQITDSPCVLILHTHSTEAYREEDGYRSSDPENNIIAVGAQIAEVLNRAGIPTIHDTTPYDEIAGYDEAYEQAARGIAAYLDKYPSIQVVIDVHRDAVSDGQGGQKPIPAEIRGEDAAGLLLVMGTDTAELPHENWKENLSFATQLQAYLSGSAPGLMRPTSLRAARYNEHFTSCSVLLEVGAAGNSMEEALRSAEFFADRLAELLRSYSGEQEG